MSNDGHDEVYLRGVSIPLAKHILIYGNPGVGKTSFINRLKRWFSIIEVNASDTRTLSQLAGIVAGAGKMTSLGNMEQIIVFDEMDNMAASGKDFLLELIGPTKAEYEQIIKESNGQPTIPLKKLLIRSSRRSRLHIIMLCNHVDKVNSTITTHDRVNVIGFGPPMPAEIEALLQLYTTKYWDEPDEQEFREELTPTPKRISEIATECNGDVRLALNMLVGGESYDMDDDTRPLEYTMMLFTSGDKDTIFDMLCGDDINPTTIITYVSYNITRFYDTTSDIQKAFDTIVKAESLKYKTDARYLWAVLVYGLPLSKYTTIRPSYPPRRKERATITTKQKKQYKVKTI